VALFRRRLIRLCRPRPSQAAAVGALLVARWGADGKRSRGTEPEWGEPMHTYPHVEERDPSVFDRKLRGVAKRLDRSEARVRAVFGTYDVISLERAYPDG
jgi:hypothetical protein